MSGFWHYFKNLSLYKKLFWLNLVLIFVEGAMRKWFMPSLSDIWMMSREPIVYYTVFSLIRSRHLKSKVAWAFMAIGVIMLITTLSVGHGNIAVALFGFRIWFFHIPYIFIIASMLNREDLMRVCHFLLLVFLPMTVLYVAQWMLPPSHILNAEIKGVVSTSDEVTNGAVRPSGTFGFNKAASCYNPIVVSLFTASWFSTYYRTRILPIKHSFLLFGIAVVVTLITSVSRGAIIQSAITIFLLACVVIFNGNRMQIGKMTSGIIVIGFLSLVLSNVSIGGKELMQPVTSRFESAAEVEHGTKGIIGSRVIEPYLFWRDKGRDLVPPTFGYGIGAGSNFGTKRLKLGTAWGLGEWSSQIVTNEMGLFFGGLVFFLRLGLVLYLLPLSLKCAKKKGDLLPFSLWTLSVLYFVNGDINLVMSLGWIVILMIMLIASIRLSVSTTDKYNQNV